MANPTPRQLVYKALNKRRVVQNAPIPRIPAPVNQNPSNASLYNFSGIGGPASDRPSASLPPDRNGGQMPTDAPPVAPVEMRETPFSGMPTEARPQTPLLDAGGASTPAAPVDTRSPIEKQLAEIMDQRAKIITDPDLIEDDDSKLSNFWKGSQYAVRQSARQGGDLGHTIGALIGGGIRGLFTKKEDDIRDNTEKAGMLDKKIEGLEKRREKELEIQEKELERQSKQIKVAKDTLELIRAKNPLMAEFYEKQGYIDKDAQKALKEAGFGDVPIVNFQKFDTKEIGGTTYARPETGLPNYQPTNAPVNEPNVTVPFTTGAGTFKIPQGKAAEFATSIDANNARMTQQRNIEDENNRIEVAKANAAADAKWENDKIDVQLKVASTTGANLTNASEVQGIATQMSGLASRMTQMEMDANTAADPAVAEKLRAEWRKSADSYVEIQGKFQAAAGKTQAGEQMLAEIQKLTPSKPKAISASKIAPVKAGGKMMSRSRLQAIANGEYGGDLKKAEDAATANGWKIQ